MEYLTKGLRKWCIEKLESVGFMYLLMEHLEYHQPLKYKDATNGEEKGKL